MRMKVYFTLLAAAVFSWGLASCSDKVDESQTPESNGNERYISVRVQDAPTSPTASAKANRTTRADGGYESGNTDEGRIRNVRFYFFNEDGSAYPLTNSTPAGVNWLSYNITSMNESSDNAGTVERYTNTMVVIDGQQGTAPAFMVAVANPSALTATANSTTSSVLGDGSLSRDQLTRISLLTATYRDSTNGDFLMTNSVYGDATGTYRLATPTANHIMASREAAINNPVDIYVERLAAKVTVTYPTTGADASRWSQQTINGVEHTTYHIGYYKYNNANDSVDVYAVIDGWGLSDEQRHGKVFKDITGYDNQESGWRANLGFTPWNVAEYHRCFWEISPSFNAINDDNPINYNFNHYHKSFNNITNNDTANACYTMPNTPTAAQSEDEANRNINRTYRTKVLLAVHLMYRDASGNWQPAEISTYRGQEYLGEDNVKTAILNDIRGRLIKRTAAGTWAELDTTDIDLWPVGSQSVTQRSYQVVPNLNYMVDYAIASLDTASANTPIADYPDANAILSSYANSAEVRHDGMAYYYTSIRHLADDPATLGYFGVVRNHWYQVNITGLKGWGTPIYDPDLPIVPITPTDTEAFLAARINVLQWHVVTNNYNINGSSITTNQ